MTLIHNLFQISKLVIPKDPVDLINISLALQTIVNINIVHVSFKLSEAYYLKILNKYCMIYTSVFLAISIFFFRFI